MHMETRTGLKFLTTPHPTNPTPTLPTHKLITTADQSGSKAMAINICGICTLARLGHAHNA